MAAEFAAPESTVVAFPLASGLSTGAAPAGFTALLLSLPSAEEPALGAPAAEPPDLIKTTIPATRLRLPPVDTVRCTPVFGSTAMIRLDNVPEGKALTKIVPPWLTSTVPPSRPDRPPPLATMLWACVCALIRTTLPPALYANRLPLASSPMSIMWLSNIPEVIRLCTPVCRLTAKIAPAPPKAYSSAQ